MKTRFVVLLIAVLSLSACKNTVPNTAVVPTPTPVEIVTPATTSFKIFQLLAKNPKNVNFSPLSLKLALSSLYQEMIPAKKIKLEQFFGKTMEMERSDYYSFKTVIDTKKNPTILSELDLKGQWTSPFKKDRTILAHFQSSPYGSSTTKMMQKESIYRYFDDDHSQWLELTLMNSPVVLWLALPKKRFSLQDTVELLSPDYLKTLDGKFKKQKVEVVLPKFQLSQKQSIKEILSLTGNDLVLNKTCYVKTSKFSKNGITEITQAAYFDFNEFGINDNEEKPSTEKEPSGINIGFTKKFYADQPFIAILKNNATNEILLMGRVYQP